MYCLRGMLFVFLKEFGKVLNIWHFLKAFNKMAQSDIPYFLFYF
jgi:hypothetical protein